jgi:hypothetical protein
MKRSPNQQLALKPQDLVVLLKLVRMGSAFSTYAVLGQSLLMSASEVHASFSRARQARLLVNTEGIGVELVRPALREFVLHGARYAFPPITGSLVRGMPTAHAAPFLRDRLVLSDEPPPVWPYSKGSHRGIALQPLYPSVPDAAERDPQLYETLTMFDAIRIGAAREREIASAALTKLLA